MTQPKFAPIPLEDEVRPGYHLPPPRPWQADRPADFRRGGRPHGEGAGSPGPDQGYALRLARRFRERIVLGAGEHGEDVLTGAVVLAMARAAGFGRAPVATDIEAALLLFGFLAEAPAELVAARRKLFAGAAHDYWEQRTLVAAVPSEVLRTGIDELRRDAGRWRGSLLTSS